MSNHILHSNRLQGYMSYLPAIGLCTIAIVGIAGCFALIVGAIWMLAQIVLIATRAIVECSQAIGVTFSSGDALTKLIILCLVGGLLIQASKRVARSVTQ